ncbi:MAG: DUF6796 family protein [Ruminiclostridium sp.]
MKNKTGKADIILAVSLVGIVGVLLTIVSDLILLGRHDNAYSFLKMGMGTQSMVDIAQWRITLGSFIGVTVLPFQIAGLTSVYYGLKPSGRVMPLIVVITNVHALIMGVAFHISYAFIGSGWKLYYEVGPGNKITSELVKQFDFYWKVLVIIMLTEILVSSITYVLLILRGKTLYPKWMAILNPICVLLFVFPIIFAIPAPFGGFIAPTYMNISTMIFLTFSTVVIYKKLKIKKLS